MNVEPMSTTLEKQLNCLLSTEVTLYYKIKKAHWLAEGPTFAMLHKMLDNQAEFVLEAIDEVAERIVMLLGTPVGSLPEFTEYSEIKDFTDGHHSMAHFLSILEQDHQIVTGLIRDILTTSEEFVDPGTQDLLAGLVRDHEKALWFLRETCRPRESVSRTEKREVRPTRVA